MSDIYEGNGWDEYQKLVLHELKALNDKYADCAKEIAGIKETIAAIMVKSGVWGIIGGLIPVIVALALIFMKEI